MYPPYYIESIKFLLQFNSHVKKLSIATGYEIQLKSSHIPTEGMCGRSTVKGV